MKGRKGEDRKGNETKRGGRKRREEN
jgi:hypothetical protein